MVLRLDIALAVLRWGWCSSFGLGPSQFDTTLGPRASVNDMRTSIHRRLRKCDSEHQNHDRDTPRRRGHARRVRAIGAARSIQALIDCGLTFLPLFP